LGEIWADMIRFGQNQNCIVAESRQCSRGLKRRFYGGRVITIA